MSITHLISILVSGILILVSIVSYFQGYNISCDRIFICFIYVSLLITFYFTYSVKIANKMIKKQINLIVDDIRNIQDNFGISSRKIPPSQPSKNNIKTKHTNQKIWNHSKIIIGICLSFSIILSGCLWIYKNHTHKFYSIDKFGKEIFFKNILILFIVLVVQFLFSTIFIGNILPLDSQEILKTVLYTNLND